MADLKKQAAEMDVNGPFLSKMKEKVQEVRSPQKTKLILPNSPK